MSRESKNNYSVPMSHPHQVGSKVNKEVKLFWRCWKYSYTGSLEDEERFLFGLNFTDSETITTG